MSRSWCAVCGTLHGPHDECPGELRITQPERHGWRVLVSTGHRTEVYGVLIAPTRDCWRARILTFPNMLWSIPGGRGTIKFVGSSAQEAERAAISFVEQHCKRRGYAMLGEPAMVGSRRLEREAEPESAGEEQVAGLRRFLKVKKVRYGPAKPTVTARTGDLSLGGLFIVTDNPLPENTMIKMVLELDGFNVPLAGRVVWCRPQAEQGRPPGMAIELTKAPPMYHRYIRSLHDSVSEDGAR